MGWAHQFRRFLGHRVMIETKAGEKITGELAGEDPWFIFVERAQISTKQDTREVRALSLHKKRLSLLIDLGGIHNESFSRKNEG